MQGSSTDIAIVEANQKMFAGHLREAITRLNPLVEDPLIQIDERIRLLLAHGNLLTMAIFYINGSSEEARAVLEKAGECAQAVGDDLSYAAALDQIGMTHYYQQIAQPERDFTTALDYFQRASDIIQAQENDRLKSENVFHLGLVNQFSGDMGSAREHFQRAADLATDHPVERSFAVRHLGFVAGAAGDWEQAHLHLRESLKLRQEAEFRIGLAFSHRSLGDACMQLKNYDEALDQYRLGLELSEELGNRRGVALCWLSLGEVYEAVGNSEQARVAYRNTIGFAQEVGHAAAERIAGERLAALEAVR